MILVFDVAVTYRCNIRCKTCNVWTLTSLEDQLSLIDAENYSLFTFCIFYNSSSNTKISLRNRRSLSVDLLYASTETEL